MSNKAHDTIIRLYSSAYVLPAFQRDGFAPRQEADLELQWAAQPRRARFSPVAFGAFAILALVCVGAAGIGGF